MMPNFGPQALVIPLCPSPSALDILTPNFSTVISLTLLIISSTSDILSYPWLFPRLEYLSIRYLAGWLHHKDAKGCLAFLSRHANKLKSLYLDNTPRPERFIRIIQKSGFPATSSLVVTPAKLRDFCLLNHLRNHFSSIGSLIIARTAKGIASNVTSIRAHHVVNRFVTTVDNLFPTVTTLTIADLNWDILCSREDKILQKIEKRWKRTAGQIEAKGIRLIDRFGTRVPASQTPKTSINSVSSSGSVNPLLEYWLDSPARSDSPAPSPHIATPTGEDSDKQTHRRTLEVVEMLSDWSRSTSRGQYRVCRSVTESFDPDSLNSYKTMRCELSGIGGWLSTIEVTFNL